MDMSFEEYAFYIWLIEVKGITTKEQFDEAAKPETWKKLHEEWREDMKNALVINL